MGRKKDFTAKGMEKAAKKSKLITSVVSIIVVLILVIFCIFWSSLTPIFSKPAIKKALNPKSYTVILNSTHTLKYCDGKYLDFSWSVMPAFPINTRVTITAFEFSEDGETIKYVEQVFPMPYAPKEKFKINEETIEAYVFDSKSNEDYCIKTLEKEVVKTLSVGNLKDSLRIFDMAMREDTSNIKWMGGEGIKSFIEYLVKNAESLNYYGSMIEYDEDLSFVNAYNVVLGKLKSMEVVAMKNGIVAATYSYYFRDVNKTKFEFQFAN